MMRTGPPRDGASDPETSPSPGLSPDVLLGRSRQAAEALLNVAHVTPVLTCTALDQRAHQQLFLKCENLQKVGAFKFRGAYFATGVMPPERAARGVVTHSSGNHAQALALAARLRGLSAHIVMPVDAPDVKRRAVLGYGARVVPCEPTLEARESTAAAVLEETGGTLIPPYDHPDIIAGQGTVALELLAQVPELDVVVVPVGGGGLLSGIALVIKALRPSTFVVAAEPEGADDAARSKAAGHWIPQLAPRTVADGLRTSLGRWTWPVVRDYVDAVMTVSDADILAAMRMLWERAKLVVEPSGAVGLAAASLPDFTQRYGPRRRVAVVLSGGNVDLDRLPRPSTEER